MSDSTTDNFWQAFRNFPPEPAPLVFRLYYNEHGDPLVYTTELIPGEFIEVDSGTFYRESKNVQVVNGQLVNKPLHKTFKKLKPSNSGTACALSDVCLVVAQEQPHTKWTLT